jgi:hypothetical protein
MSKARVYARAGRSFRSLTTAFLAPAAAVVVLLTGLIALPSSAVSGAPIAHASGAGAPCNVKVSAGSGTVVGSLIVGITAGSTTVTLDCNASSSAAFAVEASMFGALGASSVVLASEADTSALGTFAPSTTDTGCPAGTAGSCELATFAVPSTFAASDAKAACPPTQAQINAGVYGCALAVATAAQALVPGGEYLLTYASETTPPNASSIAATTATGPPGGTLTISDAIGSNGYWWGNAVQQFQALALGAAPAAPPASCVAGGYGNVPAPFLKVNWFGAGSTTPTAGSAAGVTISNDCYDGSTLFAPVLGGTVPVPATLANGTKYTMFLCELNATPFPSNDPNATADCGPAPAGASWIDASVSFSAAAGTAQAALTLTSVSGTLGTPLTLAAGGGSGTGALSYVAANGTAAGCTITGASLTASSAGTCSVVASKAADSTYFAVSSTPTTVTLAGLPAVKLVTSRVALSKSAKVLPIKISCSGAACNGTLTVSAVVKVKVKHGASTVTKSENLTFGSVGYHLSAGTSKSVTIRLSAASRKYLVANPLRPTISASVSITDNLGKKHTLGRVSLLK